MNPERPKLKVVFHPRVSSKKQAVEGESLEVQTEQLRLFAERSGWDWQSAAVFPESFSGWKPGRQVFDDILDFFDANRDYTVYVFKSIDRFTRGGADDYGPMKRQLMRRGIHMADLWGVVQPSVNTMEDLGVEYKWSRYSPS